MKKNLTLVKVGGAVVENERNLHLFIDAFVAIEGLKILVHGGGKIASQLASQLGIEVKMIDGRRVTDDKMIDVVAMTYGGLINKKLVASINSKGTLSIGLTGADGNCILASRRPIINDLDYGWVGDIQIVNSTFIDELLKSNLIPIMAPLTHDGEGHLLNTNADTVASEVGVALSELYDVSINYIFDLPGVLEDVSNQDSLIKSIDAEKYQLLREQAVVANGMIPKLDNAFSAVNRGVCQVRLLNISALSQLNNPDFNEYTTIH